MDIYNNMLKEEIERIIFQYVDDLKIKFINPNISIDDYLKDIEIDVEARESYDYHYQIIDKKFNLSDEVLSSKTDLNFKEFFRDFYKSVRKAFLEELKDIYCKDKLATGDADKAINKLLEERYKKIECDFQELDRFDVLYSEKKEAKKSNVL